MHPSPRHAGPRSDGAVMRPVGGASEPPDSSRPNPLSTPKPSGWSLFLGFFRQILWECPIECARFRGERQFISVILYLLHPIPSALLKKNPRTSDPHTRRRAPGHFRARLGAILLSCEKVLTLGEGTDHNKHIYQTALRELGWTGLRGTLTPTVSPTVEPDPDNAGGGKAGAIQAVLQ